MADTPPDPSQTSELVTILKGLLGPVGSAAMGMLVRWSEDYRRTQRWSWKRVLIESPAIAGFGIMGGGIADYLEAPDTFGWALAAIMATHGSRGFFDLITDLLNRRK